MMHAKLIIVAIVLIIVLPSGIWFYRRKNGMSSLGKATKQIYKRPPKIKLVYDRKRKNNELPQIKSSKDIYNIVLPFYKREMNLREMFSIIVLNKANRALGFIELSKGGISGTVADAKQIFGAALGTTASAIILIHNHPSGNLRPSTADTRLTNKMIEAGKNLDIAILDHVIVTDSGYYSFADDGMI